MNRVTNILPGTGPRPALDPARRSKPCQLIVLDVDPRGSQWLPRITAILSLLCCSFAWSVSVPGVRERVGTGIQVNGVRNLVINNSTQVFVDGAPLSGPVPNERVGTGVRIRAVAGAGADPDLLAGTLAQIWIDQELLGLVTSSNPLRVMGQTVAVNGDTVLEGLTDPAQLVVGNAVGVSAYFDSNGSAVASRVVKPPVAPSRWRISGFLTAYNAAASEATVGNQPIRFVGQTPQACATPLAVGSFVELRATAIAGFTPGQLIDTVFDLRCAAAAPFGTVGSAGAVEAVVSTAGTNVFSLGNLGVQYDAQTEFLRGGSGDIAVGVRLEAAGTFVSAGVLQANRIVFIQPPIRIRAPVAPGDVVIGQSVLALGEIFRSNAQLRDDDGIYAAGLSAPRHVELRGYVDRNGGVFALRARIRSNTPMPSDIELTGPVGTISAPTFSVLGITVLTGAGTVFLDGAGAPINSTAFFAALSTGAPVEAFGASYNASTHELLPTTVQLGDEPPMRRSARPLGGQGGMIQGTVSAYDDTDGLHADGFE